jgi:cell wall-associated NlpC family hydrolase
MRVVYRVLFVLMVLAGPMLIAPRAQAVESVVPVVREAVGSPYVWGAAGPEAFDCSGLVVWAYAQIGISLPHSSYALANGGEPVDRADLEPGDVVTFYPSASHVGIYVGDGDVIHASRRGRPVLEVPLDAAGPFHNARRY